MPPQNMPTWPTDGPSPGERVLVLEQYWLTLILEGCKTVEVRGTRCQPGGAWLGSGGIVQAFVRFGEPRRIWSLDEFQQEIQAHRVSRGDLPYKTTWLWPILEVRAVQPGVRYDNSPGPVVWRRFGRPVCVRSQQPPRKRPAALDAAAAEPRGEIDR